MRRWRSCAWSAAAHGGRLEVCGVELGAVVEEVLLSPVLDHFVELPARDTQLVRDLYEETFGLALMSWVEQNIERFGSPLGRFHDNPVDLVIALSGALLLCLPRPLVC